MRRTQLYLDDDLWSMLHLRARTEKTTVSDLVRKAIREQYPDNREKRIAAMKAWVGIRAGEKFEKSVTAEVREMRKGRRRERLLAR